jgi:predicted nuclease of predicted toxin-antitoxin system
MGTLASELGPVADRFSPDPRVYADANIPAGLVEFMRTCLHWDVLFVMEHDDLRRAPDLEHFRLARRLRRTLITLDRDYLDDRRFPLAECAGVLVVSAANETLLARLLSRLDRAVFRPRRRRRSRRRAGSAPAETAPSSLPPTDRCEQAEPPPVALPLDGRKLHVYPDWTGGQGQS